MIIAFLLWSFCALTFFVLGVICIKSQKAVGFFTHVNPPSVKDIRGYNRAVAALWFAAAAGMETAGIPLLFLEQNSPLFVPMILAVLFLCIGMMIAYFRIEAAYRK